MRAGFPIAFAAALALALAAGGPARAGQEGRESGAESGAGSEGMEGSARLDQLFGALARAGPGEWQVIEREIREIWSQSGSPTLDLLLSRGAKALEEDDIEAAIEHFTALIDHAPDFAEGWNGRATAYFRAGLYGPALEDLARVLTLEPRHFGALSGLAVILGETGQTDRALAAWREVLELNPNHTGAREAMAALERARGQFDL